MDIFDSIFLGSIIGLSLALFFALGVWSERAVQRDRKGKELLDNKNK